MKHTAKTYIGLAIVFLGSAVVTLLLPFHEVFKGIAAIPGIGSLIIALYQLLRDQASYEKQVALQRQQQFFNLGVTSHMANVAFDKHVEFCEKYMAEVHLTMSTLFRRGPTEDVMGHARDLFLLRQEYAAWITADISRKLDPFQNALSKLGSQARLVESMRDENTTQKILLEMYDTFDNIMDLEKKDREKINPDIAVENIKTRIRAILGIEELTLIREKVIKEAIKSIE